MKNVSEIASEPNFNAIRGLTFNAIDNRGSQYEAGRYRQALAEHGLVGSMARRGNPYDTPRRRAS